MGQIRPRRYITRGDAVAEPVLESHPQEGQRLCLPRRVADAGTHCELARIGALGGCSELAYVIRLDVPPWNEWHAECGVQGRQGCVEVLVRSKVVAVVVDDLRDQHQHQRGAAEAPQVPERGTLYRRLAFGVRKQRPVRLGGARSVDGPGIGSQIRLAGPLR